MVGTNRQPIRSYQIELVELFLLRLDLEELKGKVHVTPAVIGSCDPAGYVLFITYLWTSFYSTLSSFFAEGWLFWHFQVILCYH